MNILKRFLRRLKFRRTIKVDESTNVIDGMVKAKRLYKELCLIADPDRNQDKKEIAEELMKQIVANKHNYSALVSLKKKVTDNLM